MEKKTIVFKRGLSIGQKLRGGLTSKFWRIRGLSRVSSSSQILTHLTWGRDTPWSKNTYFKFCQIGEEQIIRSHQRLQIQASVTLSKLGGGGNEDFLVFTIIAKSWARSRQDQTAKFPNNISFFEKQKLFLFYQNVTADIISHFLYTI